MPSSEGPASASTGTRQSESAAGHATRTSASRPVSASSFAQRKARSSGYKSSTESEVMRSIDRLPPADVLGRRSPASHRQLNAKRSAYFEDEFAADGKRSPAVESIQKESIVMAELRTNLVIADELGVIWDLTDYVAARYHCPKTSILISLEHSRCMMFAASIEPAYTLTIYALPHLVQPTTNKRNAAMLQRHLEELLQAPPSRGYVRFVATPEENVASGGKTVASRIRELGKNGTDEKQDIPEKPSNLGRRLSIKSFRGLKSSSAVNLHGEAPSSTVNTTGGATKTKITSIPEGQSTTPEDDKLRELSDQKSSKSPPRRRSRRFPFFGGRMSPDARRSKTPSNGY
ncbi:Tautomerase/MIF [Xylariaceae sp. FL0804]|nr:Tautomerase/MIF [Xylariaceae sp. FL0804]